MSFEAILGIKVPIIHIFFGIFIPNNRKKSTRTSIMVICITAVSIMSVVLNWYFVYHLLMTIFINEPLFSSVMAEDEAVGESLLESRVILYCLPTPPLRIQDGLKALRSLIKYGSEITDMLIILTTDQYGGLQAALVRHEQPQVSDVGHIVVVCNYADSLARQGKSLTYADMGNYRKVLDDVLGNSSTPKRVYIVAPRSLKDDIHDRIPREIEHMRTMNL